MKHFDVIVAGGGVAGVCAAIAARRQGKSVLLIEKQIHLGGLATLGRIHYLEPYCDGEGNVLLHGLAKELFDRAVGCGYNDFDGKWQDGRGRYCAWFSPEAFMLELARWTQTEGVELLLDAQVIAVNRNGSRAESLLAAHVGGTEEISADAFVDATGTAQLFFLAGLPCEEGENYLTMIADTAREDTLRRALDARAPFLVRGRKNYGATLAGLRQPEGRPAGRVADGWQETEWMLAAERLMTDALKNEDVCGREIIALPMMPQIRMLRRIVGEETFTGEKEKQTERSIGLIPHFQKRGERYELPFGTLRTKECGNLFAAGRCISAAGEGWHISRVIGPCCLTGEAAGLAAAFMGDWERIAACL